MTKQTVSFFVVFLWLELELELELAYCERDLKDLAWFGQLDLSGVYGQWSIVTTDLRIKLCSKVYNSEIYHEQIE